MGEFSEALLVRANGSALSCEPQRLRRSLEAITFDAKTVPRAD